MKRRQGHLGNSRPSPNFIAANPVLARTAATALLLSLPSAAAACGVCTYAFMWNAFPPVLTWCIVGSVWFVALSWVKRATHIPSEWIPGPVASVMFVLIVLIASAWPFGPFLNLAFLPFCVVGSLSALRTTADNPAHLRGRRLVMIVGAIAVACLAVGSAFAMHRAARMSPSDKILMWNDTGLARSLMARLKKGEPASAGEYRKLIAAKPSLDAAQAAERLGDIGEPASDIPLLIAAMERADTSEDQYLKSRTKDAVRKAVAALGKVDIPATATATQMRAAWVAKQSGR